VSGQQLQCFFFAMKPFLRLVGLTRWNVKTRNGFKGPTARPKPCASTTASVATLISMSPLSIQLPIKNHIKSNHLDGLKPFQMEHCLILLKAISASSLPELLKGPTLEKFGYTFICTTRKRPKICGVRQVAGRMMSTR
jgi:hypothetical protein